MSKAYMDGKRFMQLCRRFDDLRWTISVFHRPPGGRKGWDDFTKWVIEVEPAPIEQPEVEVEEQTGE